MANFYKTQIARESMEANATVVPDGIELPAESVEGTLADIEHDTKPIEALDADHELLAEDADETDAQLDVLDEAQAAAEGAGDGEDGEDAMDAEEDMPEEAAQALDVAQESIRKRWNFDHRSSVAHESYGSRNRRQVARESLWDDIKAFLKRIWEWLKEQGRKIKDRWLKFHNQGKSIQARSKKYDEAIRKLGKQKKDEISGGFIKSLSVNGKFVGDDTPKLKTCLDSVSNFYNSHAADVISEAAQISEDVMSMSPEELKKETEELKKEFEKQNGELKEDTFAIGNMILRKENGGEDIGDFSVTLVQSEATVETSVKTPSVAELSKTNMLFNQVGKTIEKNVQNYRKVENERAKLDAGIKKLLDKIDKIKIDEKPELVENVRIARKLINATLSRANVYERLVANTQKCLAGGLNGYISAGIAAYEKTK